MSKEYSVCKIIKISIFVFEHNFYYILVLVYNLIFIIRYIIFHVRTCDDDYF